VVCGAVFSSRCLVDKWTHAVRCARDHCLAHAFVFSLIDDGTVAVVPCVAVVSEEERRLEAVNRSKDDVDKRIVTAQRAVRGLSLRSTLYMLCMHSQRVSMCTSSCVVLLCRGCASTVFFSVLFVLPALCAYCLSCLAPLLPADRGGRRSAVHNARSHPRH
jgi:hypothetical protein